MANLSEAYDFSLFEEKKSNLAAAAIPQKREEKGGQAKENVVALPKKKPKQSRRFKVHPFKMAVMTLCFGVILGTLTLLVYGQLRLTELTSEINQATTSLGDAQTMEMHLAMKAAASLGNDQVETYAEDVLGMTKITEGQVTYVNMAQQDEGEVLQKTETSFFPNLWDKFCGLFA